MGCSQSTARVAMETQIPTIRAFRIITFKTDSSFYIFLMIEAHVPPRPRDKGQRERSHNSIFFILLLYPENFNGFHRSEQHRPTELFVMFYVCAIQNSSPWTQADHLKLSQYDQGNDFFSFYSFLIDLNHHI